MAGPGDSQFNTNQPNNYGLDGATNRLTNGFIVADKYRILEFLGRGAAGSVYKVEQIYLTRLFALKLLDCGSISSNISLRFHKEAQLTSRLDHENLVRSIDYGVIGDNQPFLIMDFVQGPTLEQHLKNGGSLSLEKTLNIIIPICFALEHAHEKGLVHRDIKPGNIMLERTNSSSKDRPKLVDFGIAKAIETAGLSLTRTGEIFGTPLYMSPEQCTGKTIDQRSDIYSLGCVLFECLTGAAPFTGRTVLETIAMHMNAKPQSLKEASLGQDFPPDLEFVMQKMLAKDPNNRYQSVQLVREDLEKIRSNTPLNAELSKHQNLLAPTKEKKTPVSLIALITGGVIVTGIAIGAAGFYLGQHKSVEKTAVLVAHESIAGPLVDAKAIKPTQMLAAPDYQAITYKEQEKYFVFPREHIVGEIELLDKSDLCNGSKLPARGSFMLAQSQPVGYNADTKILVQHPEILNWFGPNDLTALTIRVDDMDDLYDEMKSFNSILPYARHLKSLHYLNLNHSPVTLEGLASIQMEDMPQLKILEISDTHFDKKAFTQLPIFKRLEFICFTESEMGNATALLDAISGCKSYKSLILRNNALTDDDCNKIARIPNIERLDISENKSITLQGIKHLRALKNLVQINLKKCAFSIDDKKALKDILPNCGIKLK